jgi:type I restriction enzyme M protein
MEDSVMANRIQSIFSASEVKHGSSLFNADELEAVEKLLIEKDGKPFIHCQIKDKYKVAKPEEIVKMGIDG